VAKLYFYYSTMNAGKSTTLLQSSYNYRERGMNTLLFSPIIDDRVKSGVIASRIGLQADAIGFDANFDFLAHVETLMTDPDHRLACVLVDEAQFLTKAQVRQLSDVADTCRLPVLTYGIRTDFRGEPFEGSKYLLAWAEELIEIKTICHCGKKATMNIRLDENGQVTTTGEQIQIGGNDTYVTTCHHHFKRGQTQRAQPTATTETETS
jgi:thymidine kinase